MYNYNITFSPAIHYLNEKILPTNNGIYLVFEIRYSKNQNNYLYEYYPLYLGKACRDTSGNKGIRERILEHFNDKEDKIYKHIELFKFFPKDFNGVITEAGTHDNTNLPPAIYITYSFSDNNKILEEVEAALIFDNRDKLTLNEKNKESYNGEDITINIEGETYGLKRKISLKNGDKAYF